MKKKLIALAVAAAAVSGSAMAWAPGGGGDSISIGGTLTPEKKAVEWDVKVGSAVSGLDAEIKAGAKETDIPVKKPILFLGMRAVKFEGRKGISPQINYAGAVDVGGFDRGITKIELPIKDKSNKNLGIMRATFLSVGMTAYADKVPGALPRVHGVFATKDHAFFGGVGQGHDNILPQAYGFNTINEFDPDILKGFPSREGQFQWGLAGEEDFAKSEFIYHGVYAGGISTLHPIKIILNTPVTGKGEAPIEWHATLPITVSYL